MTHPDKRSGERERGSDDAAKRSEGRVRRQREEGRGKTGSAGKEAHGADAVFEEDQPAAQGRTWQPFNASLPDVYMHSLFRPNWKEWPRQRSN